MKTSRSLVAGLLFAGAAALGMAVFGLAAGAAAQSASRTVFLPFVSHPSFCFIWQNQIPLQQAVEQHACVEMQSGVWSTTLRIAMPAGHVLRGVDRETTIVRAVAPWIGNDVTEHEEAVVHDNGQSGVVLANFTIDGDGRCKRQIYAVSQLWVERELAQQPEWNQQAIIARREALVQWALKRWAVEKHPDEAPSVSIDALMQRADSHGCGKELRFLIEIAQRHGLYARPWPKTLMLAHPSDLRTSIISIRTWPSGIDLWISQGQVNKRFSQVPEAQVKEWLGATKQWLSPQPLQEFAEKLDVLLHSNGS